MSGGPHHNPHGRQGQAAPWNNHLQVPNYYPRQPQVAHMSSERPMSHSPLTWHTPTPPEHQKGAPLPFRHTPTPPDKGLPYRHTPTPPDRDLKSYRHTPTPPDKGPPYRHTPTPPDMAHGVKGGMPLYRHTPPLPSDGHKPSPNPLYNLQQMITDARVGQRPPDLRDNMMSRAENLGYSRHSPGLALGSMDLSVTRSPRNGNQNGETGVPISLSVRDATKINSLDSAEITKMYQIPSFLDRKALEISKPLSPTLNTMNQSSNSPRSPKSASKMPIKKVDTILERLNSMGDGVVITPVQLNPSPHSVIVSAHSLEDSNSRGSSSSVNITPLAGLTPRPPSPAPYPAQPAVPHSVIMDSSSTKDQETSLTSNCSNEDSNSSSSDSSRSKRRRKQLKTSKIEHEHADITFVEPAVSDIAKDVSDPVIVQTSLENHASVDISRVQEPIPPNVVNVSQPVVNSNPSIENKEENNPSEKCPPADNSVPIVSKTRRKNSSESETIDNIAAMIASTDNLPKEENAVMDDGMKHFPSSLDFVRDQPMQTEQLKQVLSSPGAETVAEPVDEKKESIISLQAQDETKPPKRNRNSIPPLETSRSDLPTATDLETKTAVIKNPPEKLESQTDFVEVENELEKMFAGIEEEDPNSPSKCLDPVTGLMTENHTNLTDENLSKKKRKTPGRKKRVSRRNSMASTGVLSSDENTPKKKRKSSKRSLALDDQYSNNLDGACGNKKSKNMLNNANKRDKSKEKAKIDILSHKDAYDSGSNASSSKSRGPYLQIKGPRDSPISVSVINAPMHEEDTDKPLQKVKHFKSKSSLNSDSDFRNKVKSKGLHSSTLSMKYDAMTTDTSWICVFCKRGPHTGSSVGCVPQGLARHMGDLFGPYIISTQCADYASMLSDPQDSQFKSKPKTGTFNQNRQAKPPGRRTKAEPEPTRLSQEQMFSGMTEAGPGSYEVWVHEDCAVWAPGLHLVGARLVGLEGAVWGCCGVLCQRCGLPGASVTCIKRGCPGTMHVNCARADLWTLHQDTFVVYCKDHSQP